MRVCSTTLHLIALTAIVSVESGYFPTASCQSLPAAVVSATNKEASHGKDCGTGQYCKAWLPLNRGKPDATAIHSYFTGGQSGFSYLDQVQYLYGFGGSANSLSADMIGASTGFGLHVALGNSVTAGTPASGDTQTPTPTVAIQQLENGGDFYVKGVWPLLDAGGKSDESIPQKHLVVAFVPRIAFNFQGFGSQSTITQATEQNWNGSLEGYFEYPFNPDVAGSTVSFYSDLRTGYQGVGGEFARQVGLGHQLNFEMTEVAAGINFAGFRLGFQRFFGPEAAFGQSGVDKFNTWHLAVQFSPAAAKNASANH